MFEFPNVLKQQQIYYKTSNNQRLVKCVRSLIKVFSLVLIAQKKKVVSSAQGGQIEAICAT